MIVSVSTEEGPNTGSDHFPICIELKGKVVNEQDAYVREGGGSIE